MRASRSFNSPLLALALSCAAACAGSPPPAPATPPVQEPAAGEAAAPAPAAKPATEDETWAGEKADKSEPNANGTASEKASVPAGADSKGTETRTMEVIQKLVLDNRKAARKCYEDARRDLKDLQGNVVIHFVLDPEGKVKLAELNQERSTLKSPVVVNCVIDVFKRIPFPKSSRGMETSGNYPFNFTP
jgi:hypothetical protein